MLLLPKHKMTLEQLEAMERIHESTAVAMEERRENGQAAEFRAMAREYQAEIDGRTAA